MIGRMIELILNALQVIHDLWGLYIIATFSYIDAVKDLETFISWF